MAKKPGLIIAIGVAKKKPMSKSEDDAYDKSHGIKENSPADKRMDKKLMGKGPRSKRK